MKSQKRFVAHYQTQQLAEDAIKELKKKGYDIKKMSIIGRDCYTEQNVLGYDTIYDRMEKWGTVGLLAIGLTGLLFGFFFFFNLGASMPYLKMPIIYAFVATLIVAFISAINLGFSTSSTIKYHTCIKAQKFMLFAEGSAEQIDTMRTLLNIHSPKENSITEKENQNLLKNETLDNP